MAQIMVAMMWNMAHLKSKSLAASERSAEGIERKRLDPKLVLRRFELVEFEELLAKSADPYTFCHRKVGEDAANTVAKIDFLEDDVNQRACSVHVFRYLLQRQLRDRRSEELHQSHGSSDSIA